MSNQKLLVLLFATAVLNGCGESKTTCTCTCKCGSGEKSTIDGTNSQDECASSCQTKCGADSYSSNFVCETKGATSEMPAGLDSRE